MNEFEDDELPADELLEEDELFEDDEQPEGLAAPRRRRFRKRLQRGIGVMPTLLTLMNMLCGFWACLLGLRAMMFFADPARSSIEAEDQIKYAAILLFISMIFDMFDGRVARLTNSTSKMGKELDSLADIVSFGVAPALIFCTILFQTDGIKNPLRTIFVVGGLYVACAALRLARYNVESDDEATKPTHYFTGLPSPAAAGAIASFVLLRHLLLFPEEEGGAVTTYLAYPFSSGIMAFMWIYLAGVGLMMVSKAPYIHAANVLLKGRKPFAHLLTVLLLVLMLIWNFEWVMFLMANVYLFQGLISWIVSMVRAQKKAEHSNSDDDIEKNISQKSPLV